MKPVASNFPFSFFKSIAPALAPVIGFAMPAAAQDGLSLSNQADFSTNDRLFVDGTLSAGTYSYRWDGQDDAGLAAASGIYRYRLTVGEHTAVRSMIQTK